MRKYKIALAGYYGFENFGDELLLDASLKILENSGIDLSKVVVLSNDPIQTAEKFRVASISRWSFREVSQTLRESEYLMLGGGGLFQDSTSVRSCVWYWGLVRLAKFCGCVPFGIGQSLGVLHSRISRFLTRDALRICKIFQVRDSYSFEISRKFGVKNLLFGADLALILRCENHESMKDILAKKNILLNLRAHSKTEKFVEILASEFDKPGTLRNFRSKIIGVAMSDDDVNALMKYRTRLRISKIVLLRDFRAAENLWKDAQMCFGMRLHFGVLSRIFGVRVAMMPYDPKVSLFAEQSNIPCIYDKFVEPSQPAEIPENYLRDICKIMKAL